MSNVSDNADPNELIDLVQEIWRMNRKKPLFKRVELWLEKHKGNPDHMKAVANIQDSSNNTPSVTSRSLCPH